MPNGIRPLSSTRTPTLGIDFVAISGRQEGDRPVFLHVSLEDGGFMVRFDKEGYEYHYPLTAWRVPKARGFDITSRSSRMWCRGHFIAELEEGEMLNGRITAPRP